MNKEYKQTNMSYLEHWILYQYFSPETIEGLLEDFEELSRQVDKEYDKGLDLSDDIRRLTNQIEELESEVDDLKHENRELSREVSALEREVSSLESEIQS